MFEIFYLKAQYIKKGISKDQEQQKDLQNVYYHQMLVIQYLTC